MSCLPYCIIVMLVFEFNAVDSNSIFFVKLDEFENHEGLLSNHMKCDNGNKCDPSFLIKVKGSWGEVENESSCYIDKNFIKFNSQIGASLSNPLSYPESSLHFPITLDIRVKDCLFGSPSDDIADFYQVISDLPSPFRFSDSVDPETDTERVRKLELQSLPEAPVSIKLRVIVWHKCASYYYGNDCSKFCKTSLPGYECNNKGVPVCVSDACRTTTAPATTTSASTTQTTSSSVAKTTTSDPTTTLTALTTTTVAEAITNANSRARITTVLKRDISSTHTWEGTTTQQSTSRARNSALPSESNATGMQLNSTMLVTMGAILVAMLLAVVTVLVLLTQFPKRKVPPVTSASIRFNRGEIGYSVGITEQNYMNPAVYTHTELASPTVAPGQGTMMTRPDSGVYEDPTDPGERALPPVPSRDQCNSFVR